MALLGEPLGKLKRKKLKNPRSLIIGHPGWPLLPTAESGIRVNEMCVIGLAHR